MPLLVQSRYSPARGGHAPGDLRDAFLEAAQAYFDKKPGEPEPTVELREQRVPISKVFGLLWNCTDQMPGCEADQIAEEAEYRRATFCGTYGSAARVLLGAM
jgi:hypothetical protein